MTIKEYMAKRRLCLAAFALRDTDIPIIDIAFEYGFSSQQALTRAFTNAYGCIRMRTVCIQKKSRSDTDDYEKDCYHTFTFYQTRRFYNE